MAGESLMRAKLTTVALLSFLFGSVLLCYVAFNDGRPIYQRVLAGEMLKILSTILFNINLLPSRMNVTYFSQNPTP